jgi:uncharacterized protein
VFVDSSAWIAFLSARDQNHDEADLIFRAVIGRRDQLLTTNLVIAEVHRLILHRVGIRAAATALTRVSSSQRVRILYPSAAHDVAARRWLERLSDQVITYTDATSFAVMEAERCAQVATFDRDFTIAGFEVIRG